MSPQAALYGLTMAGARMLDLQDRVGTLEPGKDADFIVLSGEPFALATLVQETWIEGVRVFDRSDAQDRLWAEGGWGASRPQAFTWCCYDDEGEAE
jgi:cytosine/adenosine deaminase-related metal-dependent hydrolase